MIFVGDDWAEARRDVYVMDGTGQRLAGRRLPEGLEGIGGFHELLAEHADTQSEVVVGIETDRGTHRSGGGLGPRRLRSRMGRPISGGGGLWRRNWERFTPFLEFDPAIRKIIYTTNAVESLNYQLRKVTKTRGHFPTDDAVLKILYLASRNIGHHRGCELGFGTQGWKRALNAFAIAFSGRIPTTP